jgi:chromosome segregation ATPase
MQASANGLAILDPSESAAKRLQQELDEVKQRYGQIQEQKDALDLKNTGLLGQYNQAIADCSRVDHELLSVQGENRSLSEERNNLQRRLRDAHGKIKELDQHHKERDKKWHKRCESIKEEWQKANLSLRTELKEMTLQRDESRDRLQRCQNKLEAVLEALGKEVLKREEQEIETQVLRSREVVEPEFLKALRAIEGLAYKGTVKLEKLPGLLLLSSAPYVKKEEQMDTHEQIANGGEQKDAFA